MDVYEYEPLKEASSHIRLLEILPARRKTDAVECLMQQYPLDNCPDFTALSYVWGTAASKHVISINGRQHHVRANLFAAINAIRAHSPLPWTAQKPRHCKTKRHKAQFRVWIDAVSINQDDLEERGKQVRRMSKIYETATSVLVWLGPGEPLMVKAMDFLANQPSSVTEFTMPTSDMARAVEALLSCGYWQRMWIVQEIMLSQNLQLLCADRSVAWNKLSRFISSLESRHHLSEILHTPGASIVLDKCARSKSSHSSMPLDTLIERYTNQLCADVRDKVYALLGLMQTHDVPRRILVGADYTVSARSLFTIVTQHVCAHRKHRVRSAKRFKAILKNALRLTRPEMVDRRAHARGKRSEKVREAYRTRAACRMFEELKIDAG